MKAICRANNNIECIKCTQGPCNNRIELTYVKPGRSLGSLKVECNVDTSQIDEALEKAHELVGVLQKIDGLTGRITRDIDKINRYALGKQI